MTVNVYMKDYAKEKFNKYSFEDYQKSLYQTIPTVEAIHDNGFDFVLTHYTNQSRHNKPSIVSYSKEIFYIDIVWE